MNLRLSVSAFLLLTTPLSLYSAERVWHREEVRWTNTKERRAWEGAATSPGRKVTYRLAMVPLWAVEGGIVAMELVLAPDSEPNKNLLGERENRPQPFVLTVEELQAGISKSRFGAERRFPLPGNDVLRLTVKESGFGKGVGACPDCANLQSVTVVWELLER